MGESALPAVLRSSQSLLGDHLLRDGARDAALVGTDPINNVVMMEDHDGAYYAWKQAGLKDRIAVHIDAHIDFGWIPERDPEELLALRTLRELENQSSADSLWNFTGRPTDK